MKFGNEILKNVGIVAIVALMASCNNSDNDYNYWQEPVSSDEISFGDPSTLEAGSKAAVLGTSYPSDVPFAVTAWYLGQDDSGNDRSWDDWKNTTQADGGPIRYIPRTGSENNISTITRVAENTWKDSENKSYWPAKGTLTFFAFSPQSLVNSGIVSCTPAHSIQLSEFDASPAGNGKAAGNQWDVDFMTAPVLKDRTLENVGGNKLLINFQHQLALINFQAKANRDLEDNVSVYLKEIKLSKVVSKASYELTDNPKDRWTPVAYSDNRHLSDYMIFSNPDGLKLTKNSVITSTLNNGNPILVIPQTLKVLYGDVNENNYTLSVTFDKKITTVENGKQQVETRTITCYRDLSALQWKSWDLNKSYVYSLEIGGLDQILWDVSVTPFNTESVQLHPELFDKNGDVSDDIELKLAKKNLLDYKTENDGDIPLEIGIESQGEIQDGLYFLWYNIDRRYGSGLDYAVTDKNRNVVDTWYEYNDSYGAATPNELYNDVIGQGTKTYQYGLEFANGNNRSQVVYQLVKRGNNSKTAYYIYQPSSKKYLSIDFSKSTDTPAASMVSEKSKATPFNIDYLGYKKRADGTGAGLQIYYETYSDIYGSKDGTADGILSLDYLDEKVYYVLDVTMTRTYTRYYLKFNNSEICFEKKQATPNSINSTYLYIAERGLTDVEYEGWKKAHEEIGKRFETDKESLGLNLICTDNNVYGAQQTPCSEYDGRCLFDFIPLNGTVKTEKVYEINSDDRITECEIRNLHGQSDKFYNNVVGSYEKGQTVTVFGEIWAKVNNSTQKICVEKEVELDIQKIQSSDNNVVITIVDGKAKIDKAVDGAYVNCQVGLNNHPVYGTISASSNNYRFNVVQQKVYNIELNPVELNAKYPMGDKVFAAVPTASIYQYLDGVKVTPAVKTVEVVPQSVTGSEVKIENGKLVVTGTNANKHASATYTASYSDSQYGTFNNISGGVVTVDWVEYTLKLQDASIDMILPNPAGEVFGIQPRGTVYVSKNNAEATIAFENVVVTPASVANTAYAVVNGAYLIGKFAGTTTYGAYYDIPDYGSVSATGGKLIVHLNQYRLMLNKIDIKSEYYNLSSHPATGFVQRSVDGGAYSNVFQSGGVSLTQVEVSVTGVATGNKYVSLTGDNRLFATNTGTTTYSALYNLSVDGKMFELTADDGAVEVSTSISYSLRLHDVSVDVGASVAATGDVLKKVGTADSYAVESGVDVYATNSGNVLVATIVDGKIYGLTASSTTYSAELRGSNIYGKLSSSYGAKVTVISSKTNISATSLPVYGNDKWYNRVDISSTRAFQSGDVVYIDIENTGNSQCTYTATLTWDDQQSITLNAGQSGTLTFRMNNVPSWASHNAVAIYASGPFKITGMYMK
ncbi:MAG: fimbrillin family protein [Bacteroidaceae bacterium]|nr:fimbrillin family protein [Bacteroidaceae bacterium]